MFSQPQVSLPQLLKCVQILSGFQELHSQPVSPHSHHCHPLMLEASPEHGQGRDQNTIPPQIQVRVVPQAIQLLLVFLNNPEGKHTPGSVPT